MKNSITPQFLIDSAESYRNWRALEHRELLARVPTTTEIFKMIEGGWKSDAGHYDYVLTDNSATKNSEA